jgi:uncharacterized protein (UPF0332 family)
VLTENGFPTQAISRAYYAAFHAAEGALLLLGETRSKHSGVLAAFARHVVREGGVDEERGRLLRSLFERRNDADHGGLDASREDAEEAIRDAERLVDAIEAWLMAFQ